MYLAYLMHEADADIVKAIARVTQTPEGNEQTTPPQLDGSSPQILVAVLFAAVAGGLAWIGGLRTLADLAWAAAVLVALVPLTGTVARELMRGKTGVDLIALLAMGGSLALGQYLAGAVIGLMLAGGETLERYASGRARRELAALL